MLVTEIQEKLSTLESVDLSTIINIKPNLSFIEKKMICDSVIEASLSQNENDLWVCDFFNKRLIMDIGIIADFTDINLNQEETVSDYNTLTELGVMDYILENMNQNDRWFIEDMVDREIEQKIRVENGIEGILASRLKEFIEKIPDEKGIKKIMNDIPKVLNKIKPENLQILQGLVDKQGDIN